MNQKKVLNQKGKFLEKQKNICVYANRTLHKQKMKQGYMRRDPTTGETHVLCKNCGYIPQDCFYASTIRKKMKKCSQCLIRENTERRRESNNRYRRMLRYILTSEKRTDSAHSEKRIDPSPRLEEEDIRYLTEEVWHDNCALCGVQDNLAFVRWDRTEPLMPWNLVLLTKQNVRKHCALSTALEGHYAPKFLKKVNKVLHRVQKHYQKA